LSSVFGGGGWSVFSPSPSPSTVDPSTGSSSNSDWGTSYHLPSLNNLNIKFESIVLFFNEYNIIKYNVFFELYSKRLVEELFSFLITKSKYF
jgi:hypothetical protein